jgi:hypothetical protein
MQPCYIVFTPWLSKLESFTNSLHHNPGINLTRWIYVGCSSWLPLGELVTPSLGIPAVTMKPLRTAQFLGLSLVR